MKTSVLFVFALFTAILTTHAQPHLDWAKNMGKSTGLSGKSTTSDKSGNFYIASDNRITKFDISKNVVWEHHIVDSTINTTAIVYDDKGNIYSTGNFSGTVNFSPESGNHSLTALGDKDVFILKLDGLGNVVWVKQFKCESRSESRSLAIDSSGNIYSTGYFYGTTDFDPGEAVHNVSSWEQDGYISKLDSSGKFVWVKSFESTETTVGNCIATDESGNIFTIGSFSGTVDFDPGPSSYKLTSAGDLDIYIAKYDFDGKLLWAKRFGNINIDHGISIALDASGNVFTTGNFYGKPGFTPEPEMYSLPKGSVFIVKFNTNGDLLWAKPCYNSYESNVLDFVNAMSTDASGNMYVLGGTGNYEWGGNNMCIAKYDASGKYLWKLALGAEHSSGNAIAVGRSNKVYIVGTFNGTNIDFDPDESVHKMTSESPQYTVQLMKSDLFVMVLRQDPTDVHEHPDASSLLLYPNPSTTSFTLSFGKQIRNSRIKFINQIGQTVLEQMNVNGTSLTLDIADQPGGMYCIEVNEGGNVERVKVVKE